MHEALSIWKAVWHEGGDSWVGDLVFLNLGLGLEEDVTILLFADQICLVERIGLNLNRLHTF